MGLIKAYRAVPIELFRINNGPFVKLRPWDNVRKPRSYDIHLTEEGFALPKALDPSHYRAPNGASMRPNSPYQHYLAHNFFGDDVIVYAVKEGIALPSNLILVHERADHWSIQPATEMHIHDLDASIIDFLSKSAAILTIEEWLQKYPKPTSNI